jgi:hypothetical protein
MKEHNLFAIFSAVLLLILASLACGSQNADINIDAAATAVQQTIQAAPPSGGDAAGGLQPISPADLTATSVSAASQAPPTVAAGADQPEAAPTATTQNLAQQPAATQPSTSSGGQQPTAIPPSPTSPAPPTSTSPPLPTQEPAQPSSLTSSYVELYDYDASQQGVDLDNSGGAPEMAYMEYDSNDPFPGHAVGQLGGRGTSWADMGTTAPTYETCSKVNSWNPGQFIILGNYYCYHTDQLNYGYMRVDRLEQAGTGGSELSPWVLGISFTTWLP